MITIGICDDEVAYRENLKTICWYYLRTLDQEYEFAMFASGEEVLAYQGGMIHLLFLDIELPGMDGMQVMEQIRGDDRIWRVVFVTCHKEFQWNAIDLKTLAFMEKPIDPVGVEKCLRTAIRESRSNVVISYKTNGGEGFIKLDQIIYVQAKGNYTLIYAKEAVLKCFDSIKSMEEKLYGTTMLRTHKSYLVNLQNVEKMDAEFCQMKDGTTLPIGRTYVPKVKAAYFEFIKMVTIDRTKNV